MGIMAWREVLIGFHQEKSQRKQGEVFTLMAAGYTCKSVDLTQNHGYSGSP
jgi:hypothetical protein